MNLSSASTTYLNKSSNDPLASRSEKQLSPAKRSPSRSGSPFGKRLDDLKYTLTSESIGDVYNLEKLVDAITETSEKNRKNVEERLQACAEQCDHAEVKITKDAESLEESERKRMNELIGVENNLVEQINAETRKIKESRNNVLKNMEERTVAFKVEVNKTKVVTDEAYKNTFKKMDDKLNSIQENLAEMTRIRKENTEKLIQNIGGRLQKVEETLKSEKKICDRIEETLMRSVEEMNKKFSSQVETEKHRREKAEEQMLNLLDEACVKLERHQMKKRLRY